MVEASAGSFRWVNVEHPSSEDVERLGRDFGFHPRDLADLPIPKQRTKLVVRPTGSFHVLLFPIFDRDRRAVRPVELDVFIGKHHLVTVHEGTLPVVNEHYAAFHADPKRSATPLEAFLDLLDALFDGIPPMLEHVSIDENRIEGAIFDGRERTMVEEILIVRRNITEFRRTLQAHLSLLKRFLFELERSDAPPAARARINTLIDRSRDIWGHLETLKETIEALQGSNESLISFRLNDTMKRFTSMSVVIFAMTLIATLFGIRAVGTPIVNGQGAFLSIVILLAVVGTGMYLFFKRQRWV